MKDIDINMHGLGLLFMPLVGTKMAKSRFWSVPPLRKMTFWLVVLFFDSWGHDVES